MKIITKILMLAFIAFSANAQELEQTFLSLKNTGVAEFIKAHPEYDGRGTIIMVLDTGVDMGIDGLTYTSTGERKVIDVQDFTGQGDIKYYEADIDEIEIDDKEVQAFVNEDEELSVAGAGMLPLKAVDDEYFIGSVNESMWMNSGSSVRDVNGNGTTDDKFQFVTFKTATDSGETWVAFFDLDNDGTLEDEKPIRNYKENLDMFFIEHKNTVPKFTFGINIFPDEQKLVLYFDDGGHGTNCAGIAAGYKIGDSKLNGVAPGAKVMGFKLGNNNYAGGATVAESMKKAYLYADKVSKEREEPCIINMSFGIGSEIEGRAEIEQFLDGLLKDNPYLYVSTSNGNEGPGLSNTGMPSASSSVLSSGAILTQEVGTDVYGTVLDQDYILHFSSRGGEVRKPDVVSPGASIATIPNFSNRDGMWGTSMASPYSAGVMSLLLSAAKAEFPDVKIPSQLLFRILRDSAVPVKGYDYVDQGGGYINVNNAYELLKKYVKNGEVDKFETYTTTSFAPNMPDYMAPNLYIRNGLFITGKEDFVFNIERNNLIDKKKFYRILDIKSDADWLKPVQKKIHFRNDQGTTVNVRIDKTKMTEPGLYNAMITAYQSEGLRLPEINMMATVVIPYQFTPENDYRMEWTNEALSPSEQKRYFIDIPAGASTMKVKMSSLKNTYTNTWYFLHNPDGKRIALSYMNSEEDGDSDIKYYNDLKPGVYELVMVGYFRAKDVSKYNLSVEFESIMPMSGNVISNENSEMEIVNVFDETKSYLLSGSIEGYQKNYTISIDGKPDYDYDFVLRKGEREKEFDISLSKEDFNKVTDFALMIYDENGKALATDGLSYNHGSIKIRNTFGADSVNLKLTLIPAFANEPGFVDVKVKELTKLEDAGSLNVTFNGSRRVTLYPAIPVKLSCGISKSGYKIPADSDFYGNVEFKSGDESILKIPVIIK